MRVLQLNVWMGKIEGTLKRFLEDEKFDVICMQEVMYSADTTEHVKRLCFDKTRIEEAADMEYSFYSGNWGGKIANGNWEWGNLILSRIPIKETHMEFVNGEYNPDTILGEAVGNNLNIQIAKLANGVTIVNHHGFWRPNPVGDKNTVRAFERAAKAVKTVEGPVVMCGDLNVVHESPAMREFDFLRDLTFENGIETTLSVLKHNFKVPCDHILVSEDVIVKDFEVRNDALVSDHLPVIAEVEIK